MTKATEGERLVRNTLGIDDDYAGKIAKRIDRLLARERAKVAEEVRAKYGKGKR